MVKPRSQRVTNQPQHATINPRSRGDTAITVQWQSQSHTENFWLHPEKQASMKEWYGGFRAHRRGNNIEGPQRSAGNKHTFRLLTDQHPLRRRVQHTTTLTQQAILRSITFLLLAEDRHSPSPVRKPHRGCPGTARGLQWSH